MNQDFKYWANDVMTGRLDDFGDDLDIFITTLYLRHFLGRKEWAKEKCKEKGAPITQAKFKLELRYLDYSKPPVSCLCVEAGFLDIPLVCIFGADANEIKEAFARRHLTLQKIKSTESDNQIIDGEDEPLEYVA